MADDWTASAACGGMMNFDRLPLAEQRAMCYNACPVRPDCLEFGKVVNRGVDPYTPAAECVYGGHTVREQQSLDRAKRRATLAEGRP